MGIPKSIDALTKLFGELGANDPKEWAKSQVQEGIPQIHRFLFLRQAWARVTSETDHSWMQEDMARSRKNPTRPFSGLGPAIERCLAAGVKVEDLSEIVRCKEVQLLFAICYLLSDPSLDDVPEDLKNVSWCLLPVDGDVCGERQISGLHESVLEMDPTGREMRPRHA